MKCILLSILLVPGVLFAQQYPFGQSSVILPQVGYSNCAWGDYDRDGDLDLAISGTEGIVLVSRILRNDGGVFTDIQAGLMPLHDGSIEWGDYDADQQLDLLVTGKDLQGAAFTVIYRNDAGTFTNTGITLPTVPDGMACWGDYNNDGLLDILMAGGLSARILKNGGDGSFTDIGAPLPAVQSPMCSWCDYNNDGLQDAFVCGDTGGGFVTALFRNTGSSFEEVEITPEPFLGLYSGDVKWADLDNDGDLDVVISGMDLYVDAYLVAYRNDGNDQFTRFNIAYGNLLSGSIDVGDYDNDGLVDLISMGRTPGCGGTASTILLQNMGFMNFFAVSSLLPGFKAGDVTFGDANADGHSDLLFTGLDAYDVEHSTLFLNNLGSTAFGLNTPPSMPSGLAAGMVNDRFRLSWNKASDSQTPADALTYNLRIGTLSDSYEILSPLAILYSGARLVSAPGNCTSDTSWIVSGIPAGTYYYSVQAIDNGFMPGTFSDPYQFTFQPVGIGENDDTGLILSPNPCTDYITLGEPVLPDARHGSGLWQIFDSRGLLICKAARGSRVNVRSWDPGLYIAQNPDGKRIKFMKVSKE